jgi:polar amino acid transport system permease protein
VYEWDFSVVLRDGDLLLRGFAGTLKITGASLILGLIIGLIAALARLSKTRILSFPTGAYIEIFRSTPPLVQLFWAFYALPIILNVRLNAFQAAFITLSLQSGAFFAEVYRGGIVSIDRGQWEAGRAIGMGYPTLMRRVILPQAIKRMIPAFMDRAVELLKTTTLVAVIGYADLLYEAMQLSLQTYRPLEVYTIAAAFYFVVLFLASLAVRAFEGRLARAGD